MDKFFEQLKEILTEDQLAVLATSSDETTRRIGSSILNKNSLEVYKEDLRDLVGTIKLLARDAPVRPSPSPYFVKEFLDELCRDGEIANVAFIYFGGFENNVHLDHNGVQGGCDLLDKNYKSIDAAWETTSYIAEECFWDQIKDYDAITGEQIFNLFSSEVMNWIKESGIKILRPNDITNYGLTLTGRYKRGVPLTKDYKFEIGQSTDH